ncbi:MAG: hypothetical protein K8H88_03810, partial [Sandaracinaceae bacterium]|nr:hypothetical protein [Sandaracinaceae bacterium]
APLAEALSEARAHPTEHLRGPLADAMADLLVVLEDARAAAAARLGHEQRTLRDRTYAPLRGLREVLEELVDSQNLD